MANKQSNYECISAPVSFNERALQYINTSSVTRRYSREETFTVISIDIRNYSNLYDSLEQYVKGDLLEGDNAYLCEKCDKKVRKEVSSAVMFILIIIFLSL